MRNIGVILAGGNGSRFGGNLPKQFIKVAGKTIIEHTLDVFQKCESIDEVAIVINPNFTNEIETIVNNNQYNKVKKYYWVVKKEAILVWRLLMPIRMRRMPTK